jgi:alkylation response protein AidB-like acyl-CoA dehydrogenase
VISKVLSRRDLDFLLYEWLDVESLTARPRFSEHSRETFDAVLTLAEELALRDFAPHNQKSDQHEPQFDGEHVTVIPEIRSALDAFGASGMIAGAMDESLGGVQLPEIIHRAGFLWFQAANTATSAYPFLTMANASLLCEYGTPEQIDLFVRPMVEGRFFGTMCLSEPQAGSSLAEILTLAVPSGDGEYRVTGSKMWISGGDHELSENIVHLVLARTPGAPAGVKGLSLFIVPKFLVNEDGTLGERNDVALAGLNHKMGYRGTVNTFLSFGAGHVRVNGEEGAVAYLVGEQHRGLEYMFHMMNEARIAVGAGAAALGYTGYLHALDYARDRPQGRASGSKDPTTPPVPIVKHPDVRRMLLASKSYAEGAVALVLYSARLLDEQKTADTESERDRAGLLLDVLTPIVKSWPSQWCLRANDFAIQVLGGYGYAREFPVEQFYRDNRLNMIHEGTHGIQALDLLGRKVRMADGAALGALSEEVLSTVDRARAGFETFASDLENAWVRVMQVTKRLWAANDSAQALANATLYLEAFGHVVMAWIWLEQLLAAGGEEGDFYDGKRLAARYFFSYELPTINPNLEILERVDPLFLELDDAWL